MITVDEKTNKIMISKGDTGTFTVVFEDGDGYDVPEDGVQVIFTAKTRDGETEIIRKVFTVEDGAVEISLDSTDTGQPIDRYIWDLRLKWENDGRVYTPMSPGFLDITRVVGDV